MPIYFDSTHLATLGLSIQDLNNLEEKEQKQIINKAWQKLILKYHPDKNLNNEFSNQKFLEINQAHNELLKQNPQQDIGYTLEINKYFIKKDIIIPKTAFSLEMRENLSVKYNELRQMFLMLDNENDRKIFGANYAAFLNLVQKLEEMEPELNVDLANHIYNHEVNRNLEQLLKFRIKEFIISLFGEEYLDDFKYRDVLGGNENLTSVLATRKLLMPLKWAVAIINGSYLIFSTIGCYVYEQQVQIIINDLLKLKSEYDQEIAIDIQMAIFVAIKISVAITCLLSIPYIGINIFYIAMSLPFISRLLNIIASPVNNIIRPLASLIKCEPYILTALLPILSGILTYSVFSTVPMYGMITFFQYIEKAIVLFTLYEMTRLYRNLYELNPVFCVFLAVNNLITLVLNIVYPIAAEQVLDFARIINKISACFMIHSANYVLENIKEEQGKVAEVLPFPKESISNDIKSAALKFNKEANISCKFFNTPKKADYLESPNGGFLNQTFCLFGYDLNNTVLSESPKPDDSVPTMAICF